MSDARESLSLLDTAAISELKSYKKPPRIIMRVLKATLYLLGKKPKELQEWSDVVKVSFVTKLDRNSFSSSMPIS